MANITVTSTTNSISVEFNDYSSSLGTSKSTWNKTRITFGLKHSNSFVQVLVLGEPNWAVSYDGSAGTLQIDSVNGVSPSSNSDLYTKLIALLG